MNTVADVDSNGPETRNILRETIGFLIKESGVIGLTEIRGSGFD